MSNNAKYIITKRNGKPVAATWAAFHDWRKVRDRAYEQGAMRWAHKLAEAYDG